MELVWVKEAKYIQDFKLEVLFSNETVKTVDLEKYLGKPVFKPLQDIEVFKDFRLNPFTIEWPCGADFSPEFLFEIGNELAVALK